MSQVSGRKLVTAAAASTLLLLLAGMPVARAATVTVAAAGDIARPSIADPQTRTAGLISAMSPAKVLVLGDEQYEHGEYSNFLRSDLGGIQRDRRARSRQS